MFSGLLRAATVCPRTRAPRRKNGEGVKQLPVLVGLAGTTQAIAQRGSAGGPYDGGATEKGQDLPWQ